MKKEKRNPFDLSVGFHSHVSRLRPLEVSGICLKCSLYTPRGAGRFMSTESPRCLSLGPSQDCKNLAKWELVPPSVIGRKHLTPALSQISMHRATS